jgi:hypothetical protein
MAGSAERLDGSKIAGMSLRPKQRESRNPAIKDFSGHRQREPVRSKFVRGRIGPVMLTASLTGFGARAECFVDDGLDGPRAAAACDAAAEAAVNLLGASWQFVRGADGVADLMVANDVTGTNNHGNRQTLVDAGGSIVKWRVRCKRKSGFLKVFQSSQCGEFVRGAGRSDR